MNMARILTANKKEEIVNMMLCDPRITHMELSRKLGIAQETIATFIRNDVKKKYRFVMIPMDTK